MGLCRGVFLRMMPVVLLLAGLILSSCSSSLAVDHEQVSREEKMIIRFSHVVGEDTPKGQAARLFAKMIEERTHGHVEVQVFANGSLYKDSEELKALADGHVQMIAPAISKLSGLVPELGAFDLPYLKTDLAGYHQLFDGPIGQRIARELEQHNMILLAVWDSGLKQFTNNRRPFHQPEDLAGLTMRIMPSAVLDRQFTLLQVNPVAMNFTDVYLALEQGNIDGEENTVSNIYSKRFYQVQKYMTISDHGYLGYLVVMDRAFWNSLPADLQKTIVDTLQEVTRWEREQAVQLAEKNLREIENCNCIQINRLTEEEKAVWKRFYQPLYAEMEEKLGTDIFQQLDEDHPSWRR